MCTIIYLRRPEHAEWPLLIAMNRDERLNQQFDPPARHWSEYPDVIAGRDTTGSGSWLATNDAGVTAMLVNPRGTAGHVPGKRGRGHVILQAVHDAPTAEAALESLLTKEDPGSYRPFFFTVADKDKAYVVKANGSAFTVTDVPDGVSMLTPDGFNNPGCPRYDRYFQTLSAANPPDPGKGEWGAWTRLLAESHAENVFAGLCIIGHERFATLCSTLVGVNRDHAQSVYLFASGKPGIAPYLPVDLKTGIWHGARCFLLLYPASPEDSSVCRITIALRLSSVLRDYRNRDVRIMYSADYGRDCNI